MKSQKLIWKICKPSGVVDELVTVDKEGKLSADLPALLENVGFRVIKDYVWIIVKNDGSAHEIYVKEDDAEKQWCSYLVSYMRRKKIDFDIDASLAAYEAVAEQYEFPWSYRREKIR